MFVGSNLISKTFSYLGLVYTQYIVYIQFVISFF